MIPNYPVYGEIDLGSAVQDAEKCISKIKTNKYSTKDIIKLYEANAEVLKAILNENNNKK